MARAVKLTFGTTMRTQYTLPRDFPTREGDAVITETDWGNAVGWVVAEYASFPVETLKRPHRQVLRWSPMIFISMPLPVQKRINCTSWPRPDIYTDRKTWAGRGRNFPHPITDHFSGFCPWDQSHCWCLVCAGISTGLMTTGCPGAGLKRRLVRL